MAAAAPEGKNRIRIDQVCIGLHIKLDSWMGHPFLFSSFKIKNNEQIATLRSMGLTDIEYIPDKSNTKPLPLPETPPEPLPLQDEVDIDALMEEKTARIAELNQERERIRAAERKYVKTANSVQNVMRLANNNPRQAAQLSGDVADELSEIFLAEQNPYIHLMGDSIADESAYFHSINVTVLSMILARALDIQNPEVMHDVAQGAVLHDIGKAMVPSQILLKDDDLTAAESKLLQMHPGYGIKLLQGIDDLPQRVREIIMFHHETMDGSGYPKGIKAEALDQTVRIIEIANTYDNLCNQRVVARSRTPSEALSFMYKNELVKHDKQALSAFIKALGIYPPGTIVKLKSGRVGIVMSVDSSDLLHPNLMVFDSAIPKDEAAVVNLKRDLEDEVERTLRPSALPTEIHDYLSPRKRICYFADHVGSA
jgi:HD-GYP domain-containing protein (c-di-GMP phosphodiesterase class II)